VFGPFIPRLNAGAFWPVFCKSPADLEQTIGKLGALHAEVQPIPGFHALYVMQTGEQALVMVMLYASKEEAEALSAQVRTHLGQVI
jgi:hypothetical protein